MKKIFLSAFILGSLTFTSCDKNDDDNQQEEVGILPTKIMLNEDDSNTTTDYTYDNENRLIKFVEEYNEDGDYSSMWTVNLEYNGSELVKVTDNNKYISNGNENTNSTIFTFEKNGNTITVNKESSWNGQTNNNTEIIKINDKGQLLADEYYTYTYDTKGNMIKYVGDEETATFVYDNKNGAFKNSKTPQWVFEYFLYQGTFHVNNPVKMTYSDEEFPEDNEEVNIEYQYNSGNFPIQAETDYGATLIFQYNN